jgi:lipopolysaccharide/colanic/teichoic acid biosynthesis glycosyltransferase
LLPPWSVFQWQRYAPLIARRQVTRNKDLERFQTFASVGLRVLSGAATGHLTYRFLFVIYHFKYIMAALLARDPAARAEWDATRKLKNDPRVTAIGRVLRASSLDELPQIINVLRGEMSLVGPRPVQASELAAFYGAAAQHYMMVRPGITGPWQISGRSDTSYAQRVALDVAYVTHPSLWTDIKILLRTPVAVLARRGAY